MWVRSATLVGVLVKWDNVATEKPDKSKQLQGTRVWLKVGVDMHEFEKPEGSAGGIQN